jgi:hypothetical protein
VSVCLFVLQTFPYHSTHFDKIWHDDKETSWGDSIALKTVKYLV